MKLTTKALIFFAGVLFVLASASSVYFWYQVNHRPTLTKTEYVTVEKIKEVEKIKCVEIPVEKIVTIEKEVIIQKLKLPDWFRDDEDKQAIATAVIPPYEGKTHAVAIINTKTGVGEIVARQEPLGFLGFVNDSELYGKIGYNANAQIQTSVGGRWLFARAGKIKIGVYGEGSVGFGGETSFSNASAGLIFTF